MPGPRFSPGRLRALREHTHLSREQFARRIGRSAITVEKYERGEIVPSLEVLGAMAGVLEASVDSLFTEGDPGDARADYIMAVCELLPAMSDDEIAKFGAVIRARRATPKAGRQRRVPV